MNENLFPEHLRKIIEFIDFIYDPDFGHYKGYALSVEGFKEFIFEIEHPDDDLPSISCYKIENQITTQFLFSVYIQVSQATFIVLLNEFEIINDAYITDILETINEYYSNNF